MKQQVRLVKEQLIKEPHLWKVICWMTWKLRLQSRRIGWVSASSASAPHGKKGGNKIVSQCKADSFYIDVISSNDGDENDEINNSNKGNNDCKYDNIDYIIYTTQMPVHSFVDLHIY